MVRTNVEAVVDLCTLFVAGMVTRHRGAILNTASTAAFQPLPGQAVYGASKAFVLSYGRALGTELKGTGVTVTTLCPGPVETGFAEASGLSDEEAGEALPKFMWVPAPQVAKVAVEALAAGRPVIIPGAANRAGAVFAHLIPKSLILPVLAKQHPALKSK
jgi:short-subunit dehydrogenase